MAELRWLTAADEAGWDDFAALFTRYSREAIPDDHASSAAEWRDSANHAVHFEHHHVLAEEDGVAVGAVAMGMNEARPASAWMMFLYVAPEARGRGTGSLLLDAVRTTAHAKGRDRIRTSTVVGRAPGEGFVRKAGGVPGLVTEQSRCLTAQIDRAQLRAWRDRAAERAAGYSLVAFDGPCPEEHLDAFVAVIPVMNTAPHTEATEPFTPTREQVREQMAAMVEEGYEHWTVCARHDTTGEFVGYTELSLRRHTPWMAGQGDTGVHPDHRERGLGRWLKAHNALRLLDERPDVEFIQTWNASVNAPMLSINRAMGFETVARRQEWDLPACPR